LTFTTALRSALRLTNNTARNSELADNWDQVNGLAPKRTDGLFLGDYVGLAAAGDDFFAFFPVTAEDDPANAVFVPIRAQ